MKLDTDKERAMPCPTCGKSDTVEIHQTNYPGERFAVCNFNDGGCGTRTAGADNAVKAAANWNRRAAPPAPVSAEPVKWDDSRADEIVSGLYRKFKDWSRRNFGPDDVTWCEVKAEINRLISIHAIAPPAPAAPLSDAKEIERRGHYDDAKLRDIGAETYRACGELPFGYEIIIELENGAGSVTLCDPDGEKQCFEGSDYFANDIRNAIDAAIAAAKGDME